MWYQEKTVRNLTKTYMRWVPRSVWTLVLLLLAGSLWAAEDKVAFLTEKLSDPSSFKVRLKAAVLLGRLSDGRAVEPLAGALQDRNYVVRGAAARALGNLGHPMAASAVKPMLELLSDEESFVRTETRRALERLSGEKSLPVLVEALEHNNPQVRLALVHVLAATNLPEASIALVPALGDEDEEVRAEAIVAVNGMGQAVAELVILTALTKSSNHRVQVTAARLAGELKVFTVMDELAEMLVKDDVVMEVKREATEALSLMKSRMDLQKQITLLGSEDQAQRDQAIRLLGIHGSRKAVDALMGLLRSEDPFVRRRAVTALGKAGDPRAIPALEFMRKADQPPRLLEQIERTLRLLNKN